MRRHPELAHLAAHRDHLGDTRDGEEPRPDGEVGGLAQLHRCGPLASDGDEQDLAHDRADRAHLRQRIGRQLIADEGKPLGDLLAIAIDVGAPVELDIDHREPDARDRAHPRYAGHAVHLCFDREGDELLDLDRREALRLGHDGDGRLVEVREHIDRQPRDCERAEKHDAREREDRNRLRTDWPTGR